MAIENLFDRASSVMTVISFITFIGIMCLFNLYRLLTGQVQESELSDVMEEGMSEVDEIAAEVGQKA